MSCKSDTTIPLIPGCTYHVFNRGNEERPIFFEEDNYAHFLKRYQDYTKGYIETYAYCLLENHFHFCYKIKSVKDILHTALKDEKFKLDKHFIRRYVDPYIRSISDENGLSDNVPVRSLVDKHAIQELLNEKSLYYRSRAVHCALVHHVLLENERVGHIPTSFEKHPAGMEELPFSLQLCSYLASQRMQRFFLSYAKFINNQQNRTGSLFQKCFHRKFIATEGDMRTVVSYIHHNVIHHGCGATYEEHEWSSYREYLSTEGYAITEEGALEMLFGDPAEFVRCSEIYRQIKEKSLTRVGYINIQLNGHQ